MGSGIAECCARAGCAVRVWEPSEEALAAGIARVEGSLEREVASERLTAAEAQDARARMVGTTRLEEIAEDDLILEAVVEELEVKRELLGRVDRIVPPGVVLASNTSALPITTLAAATGRPGRVVGLHFFLPATRMRLVEVIPTLATDPAVLEGVLDFVRALGKEPIVCRDRAGFVVNRLLVPYLLDAVRVLEEGGGGVEALDRAMTLGCGYPMGPFTLLDRVGLDTVVRMTMTLYEEFGDVRFLPPPLLRRLVAMGRLGRKSGEGFYDYRTDPPTPLSL